ncbi:DUF4838 domain-containing protein [Adhaeribacter radiodurans]|uniref:DUF4838 domain-containing protein n=1 Tax=Adhaeribacter radiodurans TaxID=2745197 RepID=A0A7L7L568_9BACT|nr:DUF4838 domain-containing protein [Adhaeribacter radiodurans]QMU27529.1 DUF4838 domain-containing protein [Adhaeribacter radiodurans]
MAKSTTCPARVQSVFILFFSISFLLTSLPLSAQKKSRQKTTSTTATNIVLTDKETSRYRIVVPAAATPHELKASQVLQDYLLQISGVALPIVADNKGRSRYEIVLGQNERLAEAGIAVDFNKLKEDGFLIKTDSLRLIIAGGNEKGTLYGVYTFLEKYLGCRMYSDKVKVIPTQKRIALAQINDLQVPVILFRDTHYRGTWDAEYTDWHKLDHDKEGGRPDWGMWVHTFNELVPPQNYYKEHPEYFSMVNGKRIPTQLCLTNPTVLEITIQNLRRKIAQNPTATYWSVSQNDNRNFCTCDNCRAIDEREGSPSGSIIQFVNQVAQQFPDKVISTLAYEYGRKAPKSLKPQRNVNIMLCSIEVNRDKPISEDPTSDDFRRDVEEWGKISKDIIVWDYVIQFNHLVSPFPNLHVLQPNIAFFAKHGVTAMFEQGNREVGGEFAELRSYLISKLLWDPNQNVDVLMDDFLQGYYGAAAKPIRTYINEMREALQKSGATLKIFGTPYDAATSYLTPALIRRYEQLFDEAEVAVNQDATLLERVKIARLPLEYAIMEQAKKNFTGEQGVFVKTDGQWKVRSAIRAKIDPFVDLCNRQGVTQVKEWSTSPEEYRAAMYRLFSQGMKEHLACNKKVKFLSPVSESLPAEANKMLTDGVRGSHDYAFNWFSFSGKDLEVVIDLEEIKPVKRIESAYHQFAFWLGILPKKVEYSVSIDGENFEQVGLVNNTLPIDQYGGIQRDFVSEFTPRNARYVKVKAYTIGNTPEWHPGAGRPANMRIDEIVVE